MLGWHGKTTVRSFPSSRGSARSNLPPLSKSASAPAFVGNSNDGGSGGSFAAPEDMPSGGETTPDDGGSGGSFAASTDPMIAVSMMLPAALLALLK